MALGGAGNWQRCRCPGCLHVPGRQGTEIASRSLAAGDGHTRARRTRLRTPRQRSHALVRLSLSAGSHLMPPSTFRTACTRDSPLGDELCGVGILPSGSMVLPCLTEPHSPHGRHPRIRHRDTAPPRATRRHQLAGGRARVAVVRTWYRHGTGTPLDGRRHSLPSGALATVCVGTTAASGCSL